MNPAKLAANPTPRTPDAPTPTNPTAWSLLEELWAIRTRLIAAQEAATRLQDWDARDAFSTAYQQLTPALRTLGEEADRG